MRSLLLDTETTDLITNSLQPLERQPRIIEFFGLSLMELEEGGTLGFRCNPGIKIPEVVTNITGITDAMVADEPPFSTHAADVKRLIEAHDEVVAHNLSYDKAVIDIEMKRCGLTVDWPELICTVEQSIHYKGFRLSLAALYEFLFKENFTGAHRAETDVRAMARCFIEMRRRGDI